MTNIKEKADRKRSLDGRVDKQIGDEIRAEAASTGKWRFPFQSSWPEVVQSLAKKHPDMYESEIKALRVVEKRFRKLEAEDAMEVLSEELQDFNTFDELIRVLRIASRQQRTPLNRLIVTMAADLLEKISKKGYRPPKPSARQRHDKRRDTRRQVQLHWALKRKYMTVEDFKAHMHDDFGIAEGTVLKIIYATENPFLKWQTRASSF